MLPDACVDLVHVAGHGAFVAGPDTLPVLPGTLGIAGPVTGLRLRPGRAGAALGLPMAELRDRRVSLAELWGRAGAELAERLDEAACTGARHALLLDAVARRRGPDDELAAGAVVLLAARPGRRVAEVAAELALSDRQLLRRLRAAVGYGPKTLARILRFQRLLALAERGGGAGIGLAELALAAGYADQPHMTGEVTRLAGAPPTRVLGVEHARGDRQLVGSVQDPAERAA